MTNSHQPLKQLEEYLPKIIGFSYQKTGRKEDAEDLAQEIVLQLLLSLQKGTEIANINAFVWSVSQHTFCKWLRAKKRGSTAYLPDSYPAEEDAENSYILREERALLRREIALLSPKYRETLVLHYFEGKSCEEIAEQLDKRIGTVKWWLHDARKLLKEGMMVMREYGERSFHPGVLFVSCQGNLGMHDEPMSSVKRKSAQNILLAAYRRPLTMEELSLEMGIAAPYMDDEVRFLCDQQLMKEVSQGQYQTDFVILPGENKGIGDRIHSDCFPGYFQDLIAYLETKKELLQSPPFNTAGFLWNRLLWVYLPMLTDLMLCRFKQEECHVVVYADIPLRPHGGKWIALGYENRLFSDLTGASKQPYHYFDGPVHKTGKAFAQGFFHYWSGLDSRVFFDIPDEVFALCGRIILKDQAVSGLNEEEKEMFSIAVEKGLFIKTEQGFKQNYYAVDRKTMESLGKIAAGFYETAVSYFRRGYQSILEMYRSYIPEHLKWQMGNFLSNHLGNFTTCSLFEGMNSGVLSPPDDENRTWLSLFAWD